MRAGVGAECSRRPAEVNGTVAASAGAEIYVHIHINRYRYIYIYSHIYAYKIGERDRGGVGGRGATEGRNREPAGAVGLGHAGLDGPTAAVTAAASYLD